MLFFWGLPVMPPEAAYMESVIPLSGIHPISGICLFTAPFVKIPIPCDFICHAFHGLVSFKIKQGECSIIRGVVIGVVKLFIKCVLHMRHSFHFLIGGAAFLYSCSRMIEIAEMNRERSVSVHVFFLLFVIHFFDFLVKAC